MLMIAVYICSYMHHYFATHLPLLRYDWTFVVFGFVTMYCTILNAKISANDLSRKVFFSNDLQSGKKGFVVAERWRRTRTPAKQRWHGGWAMNGVLDHLIIFWNSQKFIENFPKSFGSWWIWDKILDCWMIHAHTIHVYMVCLPTWKSWKSININHSCT